MKKAKKEFLNIVDPYYLRKIPATQTLMAHHKFDEITLFCFDAQTSRNILEWFIENFGELDEPKETLEKDRGKVKQKA
jgi:hypothetical protein